MALCAALIGLGGGRVSKAQDARRDVISADDYRVRVTAALALGKTKPPEARALLERALGDPHPTVRAAAAAALGAVGDPGAVAALERHLSSEGAPAVQTQLRSAINALKGGGAGAATAAGGGRGRWIVQIGHIKNLTTVRGDQLGDVMRQSANERAREIPGAVVVADVPSALSLAQQQHIPVLVLDGSLTRMAQRPDPGSNQVAFSAAVEFSLRKIPEQVLKASLSGAATSIGTKSSLVNASRVNALQDQAVDGAVQSALRGADRGMEAAAK
jgi:hypothetical protein